MTTKLIGLMLARNESWVLGLSVPAALRWVDHLIVLNHASTDATPRMLDIYAAENPGRITILDAPETGSWEEMDLRQRMLEAGRAAGGTHFAIIDADEVVTANLLIVARDAILRAGPGEAVALPMVSCWGSPRTRRTDGNFGGAKIDIGFRDAPGLAWRPTDGYQYHARLPKGIAARRELAPLGGVFHLQYLTMARLRAKAAWYKCLETVRYPGRSTPAALNAKYDWAVNAGPAALAPVPPAWWAGHPVGACRYFDEPWQLAELRAIVLGNGLSKFAGLDLFGLVRV